MKPFGNEGIWNCFFMKIVLIGYMGSGKSSVGKQLAATLGYNFVDLDAQIEREETKTISEIFSEKGEIYFRKKENSVLKRFVNSTENLVLASGGGTPCYGDAIDFLTYKEKTITIYLKSSLDILTNRLFSERAIRPLISYIEDKDTLKDFIRKHLFERSFYYNQAKIVVNTDDTSIENIVEVIVSGLF